MTEEETKAAIKYIEDNQYIILDAFNESIKRSEKAIQEGVESARTILADPKSTSAEKFLAKAILDVSGWIDAEKGRLK
jgi:hypothetical protein